MNKCGHGHQFKGQCPICRADHEGVARVIASGMHDTSPAQPSARAQEMLVHATVAARGEANHHAIRELREKVEALEKRMHYIDASLAVEQLDALAKRIEALEQVVVDCIKRIEELERRQPKHEPIMIPDAVNDGTGWKPR